MIQIDLQDKIDFNEDIPPQKKKKNEKKKETEKNEKEQKILNT